MEKFLREGGFPILGGKFYVTSLKLDFWPPFLYYHPIFEIFAVILSDYFISCANLSAKFIGESTFLS